MATTAPSQTIVPRSAQPLTPAPQVDIVVPVFNEEADLARSVFRLYAYLTENVPFTFRVTIADNASADRTWPIALWLAEVLPGVRAVHLEQRGRGRALRTVWQASDAGVLAYMDVDLSTDLAALLPLVAPLLSGHSDLAIGTRLARTSLVVRGARREVISRCYNLLLRATLGARFSDAQCGFKAIRADRAHELLPLVEDTGWFFDTELLVLAERTGLRIHEVPVDWLDDPDSRVEIVPTALADVRGIARLSRTLTSGKLALPAAPERRRALPAAAGAPARLPRQLWRFSLIGLASTLAYLALYLLAREALSAQWANGLALLVTAVANTAANRRLTFGVRGAPGRLRHQGQGLAVFGLGLAVTSGSLFVLHRSDPSAARGLELAVLVAANVTATLLRFCLFRAWLFPHRTGHPMRRTWAMTTAPDLAAAPAADFQQAGIEGEATRRSPARLRRLWRGRPEEPTWARPALFALLAATALLYLVGLGRSGWANAFYSAAVQAGAHSWKAFFFGSSDAANFITVDKPPASLWVMDLSARLFGVNSWSILVPQALEGVACVGVLYLTVRRWFGPGAGLLAGLVLALTPVATLMFRFNNPDALLVLLLTLGVWAVTRALEKADTRWLVLAAVFIGLGFTTKMLQALLVVPALATAYAIAAPTSPGRRARQLATAGVALLVSCGWWVAIVQLWPAASRPYIGGSQTNSVVELTFGYNGLGRLSGNETGSVVPGGAGRAGAWGATGLGRLFSSSWGGQIAWLLPAALLFLVALLWLSRRAPRGDRTRAAAVIWGGSLLVTAVLFSFAQGIIHEYYAVALAPAIGALVGIGATALWDRRSKVGWRLCLAGVVATSAVWSFVLLDRSPAWQPWLRPIVLGGGLLAAALLVVADRLARRAALALASVGVALALAGPALYSVQTAAAAHTGSLPSAGPAVSGGTGGRFGPGGGRGGIGFGGGGPNGSTIQAGTGATIFAGAPSANGAPNTPAGGANAPAAGGTNVAGFDGTGAAAGRTGAAGGLLDASRPSAALVGLLENNAGRYTWVAATVGAQSAAGYQLATDDPVMSLGGFNGSDPYPTLAEFEALVGAGKVHYFIAGGTGGSSAGNQMSGGSASMSAISAWVAAHFTSRTVGGITVYDLTSRSS